LGDWGAKNIVTISVPQLRRVEGAPKSGRIPCHKLVQEQLQELFAALERARSVKEGA